MSRPIAGRRPGRRRGRDRRARPELVPHGRLPEPDRRRGARWVPPCRVARWTLKRWRVSWPRAPATPGAERIAAGPRRCRPPPRHRVRAPTGPPAANSSLKVEEASWLPSAFRDLETFLHGHLPATGPDTGLILLLTDRDRPRGARGACPRRPSRRRTSSACAPRRSSRRELDAALDAALTPAGRLVVPEAPDLPAPVAALVGTATAAPAPDRAPGPRPRHRTRTRSGATTRSTWQRPTPPADRTSRGRPAAR